MSIVLEIYAVFGIVGIALTLLWEYTVPPRRVVEYKVRFCEALMAGYDRGGRECEQGGGMPPIPSPLIQFDERASRREREDVTHANCVTAFGMGRIEGWHTALATEPEDRQEEDIQEAVKQMVNWVHEHE